MAILSLLQNPDGLCPLLETLAMDVSSLLIPAVSNSISISCTVTLRKLLDDGWVCFSTPLCLKLHLSHGKVWTMLGKTMSEKVWMDFRSLVFQTLFGCNEDKEL